METDASGVGLGAVLAQLEDGLVQPIAYASCSLQPHERNYGVTELEAFGALWAVKHFRPYLYRHPCHLFTDLKSLLNTPHPSGKLAQWGLALQESTSITTLASLMQMWMLFRVHPFHWRQQGLMGQATHLQLCLCFEAPQHPAKDGEGSLI